MREYTQLCVWPATTLGGKSALDFETFMKEEFGVRVKCAEEAETIVTREDGTHRHDLFFYVHECDVKKFAVRRLAYGIHWWEDVLMNGNGKDYTPEILKKYPDTWKRTEGEQE